MVVGYHGMVAKALFARRCIIMYETWGIKGYTV